MNDSTIALAMEIVPFLISVFVKMAFTGSTAPLVSTVLRVFFFSAKWLIKVNGDRAHASQMPKGPEVIPASLA